MWAAAIAARGGAGQDGQWIEDRVTIASPVEGEEEEHGAAVRAAAVHQCRCHRRWQGCLVIEHRQYRPDIPRVTRNDVALQDGSAPPCPPCFCCDVRPFVTSQIGCRTNQPISILWICVAIFLCRLLFTDRLLGLLSTVSGFVESVRLCICNRH
jgi:hypothetical protein